MTILGVKYVIQELLKKEKGDLAARIAVTAALQGRFYQNCLTTLARLKRDAYSRSSSSLYNPISHGPCRTRMK